MKKLIPLMLLCSLLACWSCNIEDTYTQTNVQEMLTVVEGSLKTDGGYTLTVTEDLVGPSVWRQEGARFLGLFDILNRNLDVTLKQVEPAIIQPCPDYVASEDEPQDPCELYYATVSGGYVNLGIANYRSKTSNFAHTYSFFHENTDVDLTLYIFHNGNSEDITHMSKDQLDVESRIFSLPISNVASFMSINIVMYGFSSDATGNTIVKKLELYLK